MFVSALIALGLGLANPAAQAAECVKPRPICLLPPVKHLPAGAAQATEKVKAAAGELEACICELVGEAACRTLPHYKLTEEDADTIKKVTQNATHPPTWDQLETFVLEHQPRLARVTAALSFKVIAQRLVADLETNPARRAAMWRMANWALPLCQGLVKTTQPGPVGSSGASGGPTHDVLGTRNILACAFRETGDLWKSPVLDRWPGCPCAEGRGVLLDGVCLNGYTPEGYTMNPIDARMPGMLAKLIARLNQKLRREPGGALRLTELGINGCTLMRLETGGRVKALKEGDEFIAGHISNHSRALSCDVRFIVFQRKDKSEVRLDLAPEGQVANKFPFLTALQKTLLKPDEFEKRAELWWATRRAELVKELGGTVDAVFLGLEKSLARVPEKSKELARVLPREKKSEQLLRVALTPEELEQLRLGVFARTAMAEAGFRVMDPLTNQNHSSHFHLEIADD